MRVFLGLVLLLLVAAAGTGAWLWHTFQHDLAAPLAIDTPHEFTIERGWSARRIATELTTEGVIDNPWWFELEARRTGQSARIQSGDYVIEPGTTLAGLFRLFSDGRTQQHSHTIIEGNNFREVLTRLANAEHLVSSQDLNASFDERGAAIMAALGFPDLHPEGQFFAETYQFPSDTSDTDFLVRAKRLLDEVLAEAWESRAENLPLKTPYEALILASIVEKETALASERPLIAGVFVSRLQRDRKSVV